jgi:hypothetical protein
MALAYWSYDALMQTVQTEQTVTLPPLSTRARPRALKLSSARNSHERQIHSTKCVG